MQGWIFLGRPRYQGRLRLCRRDGNSLTMAGRAADEGEQLVDLPTRVVVLPNVGMKMTMRRKWKAASRLRRMAPAGSSKTKTSEHRAPLGAPLEKVGARPHCLDVSIVPRLPFQQVHECVARANTSCFGRKEMMKVLSRMLALLCCVLFSFAASGQSPSEQPLALVVGYPAGGGLDGIARTLSDVISREMGQTMVVDNKPGVAGMIAADAVARAAPDGRSIYLAEAGFLIAPSIMAKLPVDPIKSFTPVGAVCTVPLVVVVHPSFPAKTPAEFVSALKANPKKYNYGSAGVGTLHHLAFEAFMQATGVQAVHIPYKGGSPMIGDLVSGRINIGVVSAPLAAPLIADGRVMAIGVTTSKPVAILPTTPSLSEIVPGFDAAPLVFLLAPAGTPEAVVNRLNAIVAKAVSPNEVRERLLKLGAIVETSSPAELKQIIASEIPRWAGIAKSVGVRPE